MSQNRNSIFYFISFLLGLIIGIIYCITIFGAIIGIPLIIGSTKYYDWHKMTDEEVIIHRQPILVWGIILRFSLFHLV
jgi:hypothetical protein